MPMNPSNHESATRSRDYRAAAKMARARMGADSPADEEALRSVEASDVVVVRGSYDRVEDVLSALDMPFTTIDVFQLRRLELRPDQLLVLNCPAQINERDLTKVARFVEAGGSLFTTDWALKSVLMPAFPGTVKFNGRPTGDEVVPIEVLDRTNPFLSGVMDGRDDPQWWLEGSSYPIHVVDRERVKVLIGSRELGRRHGERAVAVWFRHGEGEVFHMISHYYLQRTELRTVRHRRPAAEYFAEKGMAVPDDLRADLAGRSIGDIESATTSARMLANVIARKKQTAKERR